MNPKPHLITLALALALPLAAGCGNDNTTNGGLDRNNPEAVARAYIATYYDCGARGAGLRWDLQLHDGGENETSREDALASEQQDGCRPTRVPDIQTFRGGSNDGVQEIIVANPDACPSSDKVIIVLVRGAAGFSVDPDGDFDTSDCVRNGSTD